LCIILKNNLLCGISFMKVGKEPTYYQGEDRAVPLTAPALVAMMKYYITGHLTFERS